MKKNAIILFVVLSFLLFCAPAMSFAPVTPFSEFEKIFEELLGNPPVVVEIVLAPGASKEKREGQETKPSFHEKKKEDGLFSQFQQEKKEGGNSVEDILKNRLLQLQEESRRQKKEGENKKMEEKPRRFTLGLGLPVSSNLLLVSGSFNPRDYFMFPQKIDEYYGTRFHIINPGGEKQQAEIMASNGVVSLLKLETKTKEPVLKISEDKPRLGQWLLIIGGKLQPLKPSFFVKIGYVSSVHNSRLGIDTPNTHFSDDLKGSMVFNLKRELVGFVEDKSEMGQVEVVSISREIVEEIKKRAENKKEEGWIGIKLVNLTPELREWMGIRHNKKGALVRYFPFGGSPADAAGIEKGDIITKINGQIVYDAETAARLIEEAGAGQTLEIETSHCDGGVEKKKIKTRKREGIYFLIGS